MRQTTNYGLKITEGNDDWRNIFDDNEDNMDAIDAAIAPMTGATASADGTSGVVPEPESGDQNKFLKGDASWAIPGVMTVNGRSPDAAGNITVIEGGGSSSYGSYRLDATIPVSAWIGDGPYVATVSNQYITANMDGTETWLDDETAMLGDTTFTTSNGLLTISTTVKPTAEWSLHVALAVNGADVLADISNIREDVDDNTEAITDLSTNKAYQISIANADAITAVYNKLNALTTGTTATIYIGGTAMSNLTNSAYSSAATGTVGKVTSSNYRFNLVVGNNTPVQIDQSGMSSSSWGASTAYDVSSTLSHGTAITASSLSALKTNLLSVANKADVNGFIAVKITPSFTSDGFTSGSNYGGHIYNIYKSNGSTTYFSAIVSNNLGEDVLIGYSNGTWHFNSLKKNIDAKVNISDIIDTLTNTSTNKPLSAAQGKALNDKYTSLNNNLENIATHPQYLSQENDWDTAIENYVDSLPSVSKCHIAFVQRPAAGVVMCIIQKYFDSNYASAFTFGYWREPYVYIKDGGNWTAKKLTLNS